MCGQPAGLVAAPLAEKGITKMVPLKKHEKFKAASILNLAINTLKVMHFFVLNIFRISK